MHDKKFYGSFLSTKFTDISEIFSEGVDFLLSSLSFSSAYKFDKSLGEEEVELLKSCLLINFLFYF